MKRIPKSIHCVFTFFCSKNVGLEHQTNINPQPIFLPQSTYFLPVSRSMDGH